MSSLVIDIADQQQQFVVDHSRLRQAIVRVLTDEQIESAEISLALVDDPTIHQLNREFLGHDYPTDVISFRLDSDETVSLHPESHLHGELIVSTDTAVREAAAHGWLPDDELLLYVVHGTLHLCGYDDLTDEARPVMRGREREVLAHWQLVPTGLEA
jgi:probable rRNA maturation factor